MIDRKLEITQCGVLLTHDGWAWHEFTCLGILNLQTTDGILEQESDGTVIYDVCRSELKTCESRNPNHYGPLPDTDPLRGGG